MSVVNKFLDFFESKNHAYEFPGPIIPENDDSLMFTNSGMVQFKDIFTGQKPPPKNPNVMTIQECIRAGGKHNDLDNVGYTPTHHCMFGMLGNFSFGGYFKEEAIAMAWEFVTSKKWLGLDPDRLWVTVHIDDQETADIWAEHFCPSRVIDIHGSDNFWSMGDTGPCGYCTEIFYDNGWRLPGGLPGTPDEDGPRYVEIWNIVFMEFLCERKGQLVKDMAELPMKCVDAGMGVERVEAVVRGTHDNYKTPIFQPMIEAIEMLSRKTGGGPDTPSHRIIADHLRTVKEMVKAGLKPGKEGREYVMRRILRRMIRHWKHLDIDPFDIRKLAGEKIVQVFEEEYFLFDRTLNNGLKFLNKYLKNRNSDVFPGDLAFKLHDTYGFPLEMTLDVLKTHGIECDIEGFDECMKQQKERSK